jgi:hypothetical protein
MPLRGSKKGNRKEKEDKNGLKIPVRGISIQQNELSKDNHWH